MSTVAIPMARQSHGRERKSSILELQVPWSEDLMGGIFHSLPLVLQSVDLAHVRRYREGERSGSVIAIDPDREAYEVGLPFIRKAGVENKINYIQSDGMVILSNLLANERQEGEFDFAFVDADKENYINYHELLLKLVKVGGVIAYDNTLWQGRVAHSEHEEVEDTYRDTLRKVEQFPRF
ncbi:hypothetical protein RHSIM_Rhsim12G0026600 [Rhododendron simsii]|uniref:Caffeoyl-CoA O-methyltransferase n=1 Tax=Rhododendron simsii TaxID=118357 RepID=A0A834G475_RHOSS|nr:hypothetical protein RHSIM_Rhsim12G0026600 [Rhododendron simsii]